MLLKIILPAFIIGVVYFLGRGHASTTRRVIITQSHGYLKRWGQSPWIGRLAMILVLSAVTSAGWMVYSNWQMGRAVVEVRVVNAKTGDATVYQAIRDKIYGRMFTTVDGRRVTLADVERMEVLPGK